MGLPIKYVTQAEIRCLFNENRYFGRFLEGEFEAVDVEYVGPSPRGSPRGGFSQSVRWIIRGSYFRTVAVLHQRAGDKDGNPLGGDRPDPKRLIHNGVDYRFSRLAIPSLDCPECR
jgi:hypothetical protein